MLAGVLRGATTTPEGCFFGLWAGYGIAVNLPLVQLPEREYLLYTGPVEALTAPVASTHGQTANLAWPSDHAWYVACEIDLCWTYLAGSRALVERLLADDRLEVLPAAPDEPPTRIEPLVTELVEPAVTELLASRRPHARHDVPGDPRGGASARADATASPPPSSALPAARRARPRSLPSR